MGIEKSEGDQSDTKKGRCKLPGPKDFDFSKTPPGTESELATDIHDKAESVVAEEGGSQVLGSEVDPSDRETAICSETALIMDFLDLPEAGEEADLKKPSDQGITSAPESKGK